MRTGMPETLLATPKLFIVAEDELTPGGMNLITEGSCPGMDAARKGGGMLGLKLGMLFIGRDNPIGSMLLLCDDVDDVRTPDGGI